MLKLVLFVVFVLPIVGLTCYGVHAAGKMAQEEAHRAELRRATAQAMRTDAHLQKLRAQGMRVQYRRARVW